MLCGLALMLVPPLLIRALIDVAIPTGNLQLALLLGAGYSCCRLAAPS